MLSLSSVPNWFQQSTINNS